MATVGALPCDARCLDVGSAGGGDDTWNDYKLTDEVALQVSQHAGVLETHNLDLKFRDVFDVSISDRVVVVVPVHGLNRFLEGGDEHLRSLSDLLGEDLVEVEELLHADSQEVVAFSRVSLQLLSKHIYSGSCGEFYSLTCRRKCFVPVSPE